MRTGKSTRPTLLECMRFPVRDKRINIPSEIGLYYVMFGVLLLNDRSGAKVESFVHKHGNNAEQINMEILEEWIAGRGKLPVTWATLIEVLHDCNLSVLAAEIEALTGKCWSMHVIIMSVCQYPFVCMCRRDRVIGQSVSVDQKMHFERIMNTQFFLAT